MLWIPWTAILPILTLVFLFIAWLIERKGAYVHITVGLCCIFIYAAAYVDLTEFSPTKLYMTAISHVDFDHLDKITGDNVVMVLFSFAAIWLLRRAVQTLWKPVPELINILGVDVPDPPDVMLAYIGIDKATVNWARPHPSKPVQKFLIRVNGVVVGESPANQETAITVTGLKPSHFYNISVIAVGSNSFQAGSKNIRIRTHDPHGRPQLGNSRLPPNFEPEEQPSYPQGEHGDENGAPRSPVPGIETATMPDGVPTLTREPSTAGSAPRRNTVGRRHSPSVGSMDQKSMRKDSTSEAEVRELGERFQGIKQEIEDTVALITKEEEDNKRLLDELEQEKQQKKAEQKKKEEQTEKLKKEMGTTERAMRSTVQRRGQLEKDLKAKQAERSRYQDNITKMDKQIQEWRKEKESFEEQKKAIEEEGKEKMTTLRGLNENLQVECSQLEADLKSKREQVKLLEDERKKLPGGEDDEAWRQSNLEKRRDWQRREREWNMKLYNESKRGKELDDSLNSIHAQLQQIPQPAFALYNQAQANTTGTDFDASSLNQVKRRRDHSNSISNMVMSPAPPFASLDTLPQPHGFGATRPPPGFATGPFIDLSAEDADPEDDELRALIAGAPLSPSATALLPSNIFTDDEHDDDDDEDEPASPVSHPAPASPGKPPQGLDEPPQLGSLKNGQSQSFPRQDELDGVSSKRRISLSNWNVFNRNSVGPDTMDTYAAPGATRGFSARNLLPFGSRALTGVFDRDQGQGNSRPASIASSEIPRPSTDSGSHLWPPHTEQQGFTRSRLVWSAENNAWSRGPSRRPSMGGSPSALQTTLASADDEILDEEDLMDPQVSPSQVGVIGSRPMKKDLPKLNPAAPSFMANIFSKEKGRGRDRDRGKDVGAPASSGNDSVADRSEPRLSLSIRSRASVSESHESLSLENSFSNTTSEPSYSLKELSASASPDNVVRKILRQSSKFSLSSRLGGSKKATGSGSTAGSEREHRPSFGGSDVAENIGGEDLLGKSFDSVNSSPSIGPGKNKDGRMSGTAARWFSMGKKREKASLELEREKSAETEMPTEELPSTRTET
ncbi:hypothetical protein VPNG_04234 [Cytospora leucostoma]|uniref:Fibronectin type-III domain-containing protein n=1 Tax=Cytospora leucostoma TaxID=1230097 RepID=A0A423XDV2_9PEZI|nr:hypothetical protein VPNG_04234 [Cytospora leucostoma]